MNGSRFAGGILAVAALGTIIAMAFHPSDAHAAGTAAVVHSSMIVLLLAMGWGFVQFAASRGVWGGWVSAGLVAYAASVFAHVLAGTINGFVVPALLDPAAPVSHDIFRFAWQLNQALAKFGMIAASAAYLLWAVDLWRRDGDSLLAATGSAIGVAVPVLLLSGLVKLDVHGALLLYGLHALWAIMVGVAMARGRVQSSATAATSS